MLKQSVLNRICPLSFRGSLFRNYILFFFYVLYTDYSVDHALRLVIATNQRFSRREGASSANMRRRVQPIIYNARRAGADSLATSTADNPASFDSRRAALPPFSSYSPLPLIHGVANEPPPRGAIKDPRRRPRPVGRRPLS